MISVFLKNTHRTGWFIILPHEINNEFLGNAGRFSRDGKISGVYDVPSFSDFGADVEFSVDKLDKLYNDFTVLEKNLDEIIKIVPLPKQIGGWESYPEKFISFYKDGVNEFKKYFPESTEEDIEGILNYSSYIETSTLFTKEDMLLIISLIKKKILEAKEKGETLVFSGD